MSNRYVNFFTKFFQIQKEEKCRISLEHLQENQIFLCRNKLSHDINHVGRFVRHHWRAGYAEVTWLDKPGTTDKIYYTDEQVMELFILV